MKPQSDIMDRICKRANINPDAIAKIIAEADNCEADSCKKCIYNPIGGSRKPLNYNCSDMKASDIIVKELLKAEAQGVVLACDEMNRLLTPDGVLDINDLYLSASKNAMNSKPNTK